MKLSGAHDESFYDEVSIASQQGCAGWLLICTMRNRSAPHLEGVGSEARARVCHDEVDIHALGLVGSRLVGVRVARAVGSRPGDVPWLPVGQDHMSMRLALTGKHRMSTEQYRCRCVLR